MAEVQQTPTTTRTTTTSTTVQERCFPSDFAVQSTLVLHQQQHPQQQQFNYGHGNQMTPATQTDNKSTSTSSTSFSVSHPAPVPSHGTMVVLGLRAASGAGGGATATSNKTAAILRRNHSITSCNQFLLRTDRQRRRSSAATTNGSCTSGSSYNNNNNNSNKNEDTSGRATKDAINYNEREEEAGAGSATGEVSLKMDSMRQPQRLQGTSSNSQRGGVGTVPGGSGCDSRNVVTCDSEGGEGGGGPHPRTPVQITHHPWNCQERTLPHQSPGAGAATSGQTTTSMRVVDRRQGRPSPEDPPTSSNNHRHHHIQHHLSHPPPPPPYSKVSQPQQGFKDKSSKEVLGGRGKDIDHLEQVVSVAVVAPQQQQQQLGHYSKRVAEEVTTRRSSVKNGDVEQGLLCVRTKNHHHPQERREQQKYVPSHGGKVEGSGDVKKWQPDGNEEQPEAEDDGEDEEEEDAELNSNASRTRRRGSAGKPMYRRVLNYARRLRAAWTGGSSSGHGKRILIYDWPPFHKGRESFKAEDCWAGEWTTRPAHSPLCCLFL